tara:strand:+ start:216 stop:605 length:390 start_codon:yes stop_codon:yes gene_type:complete
MMEDQNIATPENAALYSDILRKNKELNFVGRISDPESPRIHNPDGSVSTHRMATEIDKDGNWHTFPTIVQRPDGTMHQFKDSFEAMNYGKETGEIISFGKDKETAINFGANGYKQAAQAKALRGNKNDY